MDSEKIIFTKLHFINGRLIGENVQKSYRFISDLKGLFDDIEAFENMSQQQLVYEVSSYLPEKEGTHGGLYFGITYLYPGKVGNEYFMTKGHYHENKEAAEYYWGLEGEGMLILMDENRNVWAEKVFPGSLHYIPGGVAHRMANIGNSIFSFAACWPSDAGHNYSEIARNGFSARLIDVNGVPCLI